MLCEASEDHFCFLCCLFLCFEAIFGLKIKLSKSELLLIGRVENVATLMEILGYKIFNLPVTYLGLPLGAPSKPKQFWYGII